MFPTAQYAANSDTAKTVIAVQDSAGSSRREMAPYICCVLAMSCWEWVGGNTRMLQSPDSQGVRHGTASEVEEVCLPTAHV